jgi:hypothetical protein
MTLSANIEQFATRVGEEFATTYSQIGDVTTLPFIEQNLANGVVQTFTAINGIAQSIDDQKQSGQIAAIEDSVATPTTTYSSTKIEELIAAGGGGGAAIDDVTASTTTVYSSSKVDSLVDGAALIAAFEAALTA